MIRKEKAYRTVRRNVMRATERLTAEERTEFFNRLVEAELITTDEREQLKQDWNTESP